VGPCHVIKAAWRRRGTRWDETAFKPGQGGKLPGIRTRRSQFGRFSSPGRKLGLGHKFRGVNMTFSKKNEAFPSGHPKKALSTPLGRSPLVRQGPAHFHASPRRLPVLHAAPRTAAAAAAASGSPSGQLPPQPPPLPSSPPSLQPRAEAASVLAKMLGFSTGQLLVILGACSVMMSKRSAFPPPHPDLPPASRRWRLALKGAPMRKWFILGADWQVSGTDDVPV